MCVKTEPFLANVRVYFSGFEVLRGFLSTVVTFSTGVEIERLTTNRKAIETIYVRNTRLGRFQNRSVGRNGGLTTIRKKIVF
jgi:hypothetical protein